MLIADIAQDISNESYSVELDREYATAAHFLGVVRSRERPSNLN
jgi:hypothetical protein